MINIFDLHNDYLTEIKTYDKQVNYIKKSRKHGLLNVCSAVWTTIMDKRAAFDCLDRTRYFAGRNKTNLCIEDLHFVESNEDAQKISEYNPTYVSLTWNDENRLGGGAKSFSGLTRFGEDVVKMLENKNIQIDTAHMNEKTFLDFSRITQKPILCSHSALSSIKDHPRNFKDYQLKIIAESGGLFGLCFVPEFLTEDKKASIDDIVRHIDYFVCKFSIANIAIGTDFYGTKKMPSGIHSYKDFLKIQNKLEAMGYTQSSIEKIFFRNAMNFFNE